MDCTLLKKNCYIEKNMSLRKNLGFFLQPANVRFSLLHLHITLHLTVQNEAFFLI